MKNIFLVVQLIALTGCAAARTTYLPDGRQGHSIDCSGSALNWGFCERKAGDLCQARGYDIVSAQGEQIPQSFQIASSRAQGTADARGAQFSSTSDSVGAASSNVHRTLLIACK
jgi:hypothetical protein